MKIAIIGYSCSGKTTLSHALARAHPSFKVVHTDEYQDKGFSNAMYAIFEELVNDSSNVIVEGIHTYRLLRKGVETNQLHFDLVIHCIVDPKIRTDRYTNQRDPNKLPSLPAFDKSLDKIFLDYVAMCEHYNCLPTFYSYHS